jgi:hypothetical protein
MIDVTRMKFFPDVTPCKVVCNLCGKVTEIHNNNRSIWRMVERDAKERAKSQTQIQIGLDCHHNVCTVTYLDKNNSVIYPMSKHEIGFSRFYALKVYGFLWDVFDGIQSFLWLIEELIWGC